jgi:hypothetical protein
VAARVKRAVGIEKVRERLQSAGVVRPTPEVSVDPYVKYPFLRSLLSPFEGRHQKTLSTVIAAVAATGQARSFAIAATMARWAGTRMDSAVNRFYRLLRNDRIEEDSMVSAWARQLCRSASRELLVPVDWTEWHHGLRMLKAAAVVGKRAVPLMVRVYEQVTRIRSQNSKENDFARTLAAALHSVGIRATLLCDRGFRRVSWLKLLSDLRLDFVVRLMDDVTVEQLDGTRKTLNNFVLPRGKVTDLGTVWLHSEKKLRVRVVGYFAPGAREPWWLATSLSSAPSHILKLYDRRMTVEECLRDTKGKRFGVKLAWTQFRDPQALARFAMLLGIAVLIWLLEGELAAREHPDLRMTCKYKGPRQSLLTIGIRSALLHDPAVVWTLPKLRAYLLPPALRQVHRTARGGK